MITSTIGRIFLEAYNKEYTTQYDAKTFFLEKFYPLFFDHDKQMMYVINSPFVQQLPSCRDCIMGKKNFEDKSKRKERLETFLEKVSTNDADASIAVGYAAQGFANGTSGQVTSMPSQISADDIYLSWIGAALGVKTEKEYTILFYNDDILLDIYKGWHLYRKALDETPMLDGNKINAWNAQWLIHYYDDMEYDEEDPFENYNPYGQSDTNGIFGVTLPRWTKVLELISDKVTDSKVLGYVYIYSKVNTTIGFIPFDLKGIKMPIQLYEKLFGIADRGIAEALWGTAFGFCTACTKGVIGVEAMEPKGLRPYITRGTMPKTAKNEEQTINYNVYKTWLLAMLNNDALWDKSQQLAHLLMEASTDKSKEISTKSKNLVNNVLGSTNKKQFINCITEIVPLVSDKKTLTDIVRDIHNMPNDNVPYFLTLLRFQYATND